MDTLYHGTNHGAHKQWSCFTSESNVIKYIKRVCTWTNEICALYNICELSALIALTAIEIFQVGSLHFGLAYIKLKYVL